MPTYPTTCSHRSPLGLLELILFWRSICGYTLEVLQPLSKLTLGHRSAANLFAQPPVLQPMADTLQWSSHAYKHLYSYTFQLNSLQSNYPKPTISEAFLLNLSSSCSQPDIPGLNLTSTHLCTSLAPLNRFGLYKPPDSKLTLKYLPIEPEIILSSDSKKHQALTTSRVWILQDYHPIQDYPPPEAPIWNFQATIEQY